MDTTTTTAEATELPPIKCTDNKTATNIKQFRLSLGEVSVELCSLGASITKLCLPRSGSEQNVDDVVLGYNSAEVMKQEGNPCYLGVIVGRVANRIGNSSFSLDEEDGSDATKLYNLEANNGKNHLHGGINGFNTCIWDGKIVFQEEDEEENGGKVVKYSAVRFDLHSPSGDQGYPTAIDVSATYSLAYSKQLNGGGGGVALKLVLCGSIASSSSTTAEEETTTPLNLANHSYFNLASHSHSQGILDHVLYMPSEYYTPTNEESIPTREVIQTTTPKDSVMDFQKGKLLREAIAKFGMINEGLSEEDVLKDLDEKTRCGKDLALSKQSKQPYGFDHNYVVKQHNANNNDDKSKKKGLSVAGILEHPPTKRRMTVYTDAPGVQLYTSNYLDGTSPSPTQSKEGATYRQWQGLCLETQHFPDSILTKKEREEWKDFAKGSCFILKKGDDYLHRVEYHFDTME